MLSGGQRARRVRGEVHTEDLLKRLARIGDQLSDKRSEMERARGKAEVLMARIKKEFKLEGVGELKEEIRSLAKQIASDSLAIGEGVRKLEEEYDLRKY